MKKCEKRVFDSLPSTQTYLLENLKRWTQSHYFDRG